MQQEPPQDLSLECCKSCWESFSDLLLKFKILRMNWERGESIQIPYHSAVHSSALFFLMHVDWQCKLTCKSENSCIINDADSNFVTPILFTTSIFLFWVTPTLFVLHLLFWKKRFLMNFFFEKQDKNNVFKFRLFSKRRCFLSSRHLISPVSNVCPCISICLSRTQLFLSLDCSKKMMLCAENSQQMMTDDQTYWH